jgi:predicted dehydrogenase
MRIGVIGCGNVAVRVHLPAIAATEGMDVVAVADPTPERLAEAAEAAAKIGRPDAVKMLADTVERLAPASSADYPGASRPITGQSLHFRGREAA